MRNAIVNVPLCNLQEEVEEEEEGQEELDIEEKEEPEESDDTDQHEPATEIPRLLRNLMKQPWFPDMSEGEVTIESIVGKMVDIMSNCAPLTYNEICNHLLEIQAYVNLCLRYNNTISIRTTTNNDDSNNYNIAAATAKITTTTTLLEMIITVTAKYSLPLTSSVEIGTTT